MSTLARLWDALVRLVAPGPQKRLQIPHFVAPTAPAPPARGTAAPPPEAGGAPRIRLHRDQFGVADPRRRAIALGFNATQPVSAPAELCGRDDKLDAMFDAVVDRRNHALVYGARGSGKTSLVRVFADYADQQGHVLIYTACEPGCSFAALMRPYLASIPGSCLPFAAEAAFQRGIDALPLEFSGRDLVELLGQLGSRRLIFIIDEFDRADPNVRVEIATFMKLLSDASVPVQIVLVGIARNLLDIIDDHASLRRHLSAIPIGRIGPQGVAEVISRGAERGGVRFDQRSRELIAHVACGSPYHVRLFCAQAALRALRQEQEEVDSGATLAGMMSAVEDWALLSHRDAVLFRRLVDTDAPMHRALAHVARTAALEDMVSAERLQHELGPAAANEAIARFGGALLPVEGNADCLMFRDTVAPQFFLALLLAKAALAEGAADNVISLAEAAR
jgi:hypothetical protein